MEKIISLLPGIVSGLLTSGVVSTLFSINKDIKLKRIDTVEKQRKELHDFLQNFSEYINNALAGDASYTYEDNRITIYDVASSVASVSTVYDWSDSWLLEEGNNVLPYNQQKFKELLLKKIAKEKNLENVLVNIVRLSYQHVKEVEEKLDDTDFIEIETMKNFINEVLPFLQSQINRERYKMKTQNFFRNKSLKDSRQFLSQIIKRIFENSDNKNPQKRQNVTNDSKEPENKSAEKTFNMQNPYNEPVSAYYERVFSHLFAQEGFFEFIQKKLNETGQYKKIHKDIMSSGDKNQKHYHLFEYDNTDKNATEKFYINKWCKKTSAENFIFSVLEDFEEFKKTKETN